MVLGQQACRSAAKATHLACGGGIVPYEVTSRFHSDLQPLPTRYGTVPAGSKVTVTVAIPGKPPVAHNATVATTRNQFYVPLSVAPSLQPYTVTVTAIAASTTTAAAATTTTALTGVLFGTVVLCSE